MASPDAEPASDAPAAEGEPAASKPPASFAQMLFGHFVLLAACVGLPVIFTASSPLTVINFTHEGKTANAHVSKRLLFVIPYSTADIKDVISAGESFSPGGESRTRLPSGGSRTMQTEDSAFLIIEGANGSAKVEVSPADIKSVLKKTERFITDPDEPHLRLVTVANWKFGVIAGGLLSLLTIFYIWLQLMSLLRWIRRLVRRPAA